MLLIFILLWNSDYSYLNTTKSFCEYSLFVLMGVVSSLFWVTAFRRYFQGREARWIQSAANMGTCSMGIYCSQEYFYSPHLWENVLNNNHAAVYLLWSVAILIISYNLVLLLKRNRYASLFLLGIEYSRNK